VLAREKVEKFGNIDFLTRDESRKICWQEKRVEKFGNIEFLTRESVENFAINSF
jgi:hypothetical protein